jgi:hypothetical protein
VFVCAEHCVGFLYVLDPTAIWAVLQDVAWLPFVAGLVAVLLAGVTVGAGGTVAAELSQPNGIQSDAAGVGMVDSTDSGVVDHERSPGLWDRDDKRMFSQGSGERAIPGNPEVEEPRRPPRLSEPLPGVKV